LRKEDGKLTDGATDTSVVVFVYDSKSSWSNGSSMEIIG